MIDPKTKLQDAAESHASVYKCEEHQNICSHDIICAFKAGSAFANAEMGAELAQCHRIMGTQSNKYLDEIDQLKEENARLMAALEEIKTETAVGTNEGFGDFTPLQFAARLGIIYVKSREALERKGWRANE